MYTPEAGATNLLSTMHTKYSLATSPLMVGAKFEGWLIDNTDSHWNVPEIEQDAPSALLSHPNACQRYDQLPAEVLCQHFRSMAQPV